MSTKRPDRDRSPTETPWMRVSATEVTINVVAKPGSTRAGILRVTSEGPVIGVNAAPEKGKANDELIEFVADQLRLPRSAVMIVRGARSRKKSLRIITHEPEKAAARLRRIGGQG
jgi:uncharacterized protein (TIGR00251 family)